MNLLHIAILSAIEGFTEFLPISSTAHLILTSKLLSLKNTEFLKLFEVFIQTGAVTAVFYLYFKKLTKNPRLIRNLIFSFIPTAIVGFLFYKIVKSFFFESLFSLSLNLFSIGVLFVLVERLIKENKLKLYKSLENLTLKNAIIIGLAQSFAIFPGVSRAGAVILAMLILGFKRKDSVEYSFLLSLPTIYAAGLYDLLKNLQKIQINQSEIIYLILGTVFSFIFALIAIKWLLSFLQKNTLEVFGWYRIFLAIIILLLLFY